MKFKTLMAVRRPTACSVKTKNPMLIPMIVTGVSIAGLAVSFIFIVIVFIDTVWP